MWFNNKNKARTNLLETRVKELRSEKSELLNDTNNLEPRINALQNELGRLISCKEMITEDLESKKRLIDIANDKLAGLQNQYIALLERKVNHEA